MALYGVAAASGTCEEMGTGLMCTGKQSGEGRASITVAIPVNSEERRDVQERRAEDRMARP